MARLFPTFCQFQARTLPKQPILTFNCAAGNTVSFEEMLQRGKPLATLCPI